MSEFQASHKIDLSFVGNGWDGAYIEILIPSYQAMEDVTNHQSADILEEAKAMLTFARDHFVSGKAPKGGSLVDLSAEDLVKLPINAVKKITNVMNGEDILDPKS